MVPLRKKCPFGRGAADGIASWFSNQGGKSVLVLVDCPTDGRMSHPLEVRE